MKFHKGNKNKRADEDLLNDSVVVFIVWLQTL